MSSLANPFTFSVICSNNIDVIDVEPSILLENEFQIVHNYVACIAVKETADLHFRLDQKTSCYFSSFNLLHAHTPSSKVDKMNCQINQEVIVREK